MKILLKIHEVWEIIETEAIDDKKNNMAMALLFQAIPKALILQFRELDTAKKVWEAIRTRQVGAERVKEARLQALMADFDCLTMKETETIVDFAGKLSEISSKASSLGEEIEESKLVKFLKSLLRKNYIHIVAALEQVLDLKTTGFEDIVGRLKAYKERIVDKEDIHEDQSKLYASNETQPSRTETQPSWVETQQNREYYNDYRGRNRGELAYYRGRGRGRYNGGAYNGGAYNGVRDTSRITCF